MTGRPSRCESPDCTRRGSSARCSDRTKRAAELQGELVGASWFPRDLQCAPRAIARGLAREAEALGAVVVTGLVAEAVALRGGQVEEVVAGTATARLADSVVIAAGTWSAPLAASAGLELPLEPRKASSCGSSSAPS